jgi:hypothetical protein
VVSISSRTSQFVTVSQAAAPSFLFVAEDIMNLPYGAGTDLIEIASNVNWDAFESVSWLSISPMTGSNNGVITVTYSANASTASRNGQVTVFGGGLSRVIDIHQAGAPATLSITPLIQNVTNLAGSTTFTVTSNSAWTVSESASWLSLVQTSGSLNGNFEVEYEANPGAARSETVTISWGVEQNITVTINQSAGVGVVDPLAVQIPSISVYPNPFATTANIKIDVAKNNNAEVVVYSSKGALIRKLGAFPKGTYTLSWDGKDEAGRRCSNGFYLIRYKSSDLTKTVKVLLIRN